MPKQPSAHVRVREKTTPSFESFWNVSGSQNTGSGLFVCDHSEVRKERWGVVGVEGGGDGANRPFPTILLPSGSSYHYHAATISDFFTVVQTFCEERNWRGKKEKKK